jgi:hypothetical protein
MGSRAGDNNQLLALAEALGYACQPKRISYNQLRRLPLFRTGLAIVSRKSRPLIQPPWPDLVIGVGYGSVPVPATFASRAAGVRGSFTSATRASSSKTSTCRSPRLNIRAVRARTGSNCSSR